MFQPKINKEEVNQMPLIVFEGQITLVDNPAGVPPAVEILRNSGIFGVDTETRPSFTRGTIHKVSLLQLSTVDHCFLFRLNKLPFPQEVADLMADENIVKVGLALKDDFAGLNRHHRFVPKNVIELQNIAKEYGILELGLQKIFAIVFGRKVSKSQRLTNWENHDLTHQQMQYAATDAWAVLVIYLQLLKEKKLSKKQIQILQMKVAEAEFIQQALKQKQAEEAKTE